MCCFLNNYFPSLFFIHARLFFLHMIIFPRPHTCAERILIRENTISSYEREGERVGEGNTLFFHFYIMYNVRYSVCIISFSYLLLTQLTSSNSFPLCFSYRMVKVEIIKYQLGELFFCSLAL